MTYWLRAADYRPSGFLASYARWVSGDWDVIERALDGKGTAAVVARRLTREHLRRHQKWVILRLSMHALVALDDEARAFHLRARDAQLERMTEALARFGAPAMSRADLLYSFLCVERASNAVTDGDLDALGVSITDFVRRIEQEIVFQLTGRR